jgi:PAS domain-containing protein
VVPGAVLRSFANPVFVRAAIVMVCSVGAFLLGLLVMRALRKKMNEESDFSPKSSALQDALPLHLYNNVIQQLKQQKHELHVQSQAEHSRTRIMEILNQAVLANLSTGVVVFGSNGLVKTANAAAKQILGFASPTGMSATDIFRDTLRRSENRSEKLSQESIDEPARIIDEVGAVLHEGSGRRQIEAGYVTPSGLQRFVSITLAPVHAEDGELLGVTCLLSDETNVERIRSGQELRNELASEKALELRTSLATISGYAQQLRANQNAVHVEQLAADIKNEAEQLERNVGAFLRNNFSYEKSDQRCAAAGNRT